MRLADYVMKFLADYGVRHIFMVTGGGAMHLNDAIGRESRIQYICNHHEQACAMAAEAYARVSNSLSVINVTTGPGGINALNGVFGAWTDSQPMLILSGQVKRETCMGFYDLPGLRQLGDQEVDIISMVKPITKYAELIRKPEDIRYHLEKAIHLATTGRMGPCWLDIPIDIQSARIDENSLVGYIPEPNEIDLHTLKKQSLELIDRIKTAKRPVVLLGSGIRLAQAQEQLEQLKTLLKVPMVTSWTGIDLIASDDPLYCGRQGSVGNRAGNFTVQNADLVLVLGSRLNIRQVSYNWKNFAKNAFITQIDVDQAELNKPTVQAHLKIHADLKVFLQIFNSLVTEKISKDSWLSWCRERVERYPVVQDRHVNSEKINPYHFIHELFKHFNSNEVIVCADGTACVLPNQVAIIKQGQRLFTNSGDASMGYELPAAIGAAFARPRQRIICIAGDGSIQMNLQELQTIIHHQLPIKIFIINNSGYLSIKQSQQSFFNAEYTGCTLDSGVSFPDFTRLAEVYGFKSFKLVDKSFINNIEEIINYPGPVLCEVMVDTEQIFEPKLSSRVLADGTMQSASLEDMAPFLDSEELKQNIIPTSLNPNPDSSERELNSTKEFNHQAAKQIST